MGTEKRTIELETFFPFEPITSTTGNAGAGSSVDGDVQSLAQRLAVASSSTSVGTEHLLAAACGVIPEAAERQFGAVLQGQLVELMGKSNLGWPPPALPAGAKELPLSDEVALLLRNARQEGGEESEADSGIDPDALLRALRELGDQTAAAQLICMAEIFAE